VTPFLERSAGRTDNRATERFLVFVPDVKYFAFRRESREEGRKLTVLICEINQWMPTVLLFFPRKFQVLAVCRTTRAMVRSLDVVSSPSDVLSDSSGTQGILTLGFAFGGG